MLELTIEDLARCDGEDGRPAYIGFNGLVYDASGSYHWRNGQHHFMHSAGMDLTEKIKGAPHGADLLDRLPVVGRLREG